MRCGKSVMSCPGAVEPITCRQQPPCAGTPADVPWCICTILPFPPKITLSHSNASFHILNFLNLGLEILSEQAISIRGKNYSCDSYALFISWWRKRCPPHFVIIVVIWSRTAKDWILNCQKVFQQLWQISEKWLQIRYW